MNFDIVKRLFGEQWKHLNKKWQIDLVEIY